MTEMSAADTLGWKILEDDKIVVPSSVGSATALLDHDGNVVIEGRLIARGPGGKYLVEPFAGDMDYLAGQPAVGGRLSMDRPAYRHANIPRQRRLEIATELLEHTEQASELPGMTGFRKCKHGFRLARVPLVRNAQADTGEGIYYPVPEISTGIQSFLDVSNLLCLRFNH